jgi:hypothetical protein
MGVRSQPQPQLRASSSDGAVRNGLKTRHTSFTFADDSGPPHTADPRVDNAYASPGFFVSWPSSYDQVFLRASLPDGRLRSPSLPLREMLTSDAAVETARLRQTDEHIHSRSVSAALVLQSMPNVSAAERRIREEDRST